jgi:hypothetical protein
LSSKAQRRSRPATCRNSNPPRLASRSGRAATIPLNQSAGSCVHVRQDVYLAVGVVHVLPLTRWRRSLTGGWSILQLQGGLDAAVRRRARYIKQKQCQTSHLIRLSRQY